MTPRKAKRQPEQLSLFAAKQVSVAWVAQYLDTSSETVLQLIERGYIKAYRLRPRGWWHVLHDSVVEYEEQLRREFAIDSLSAPTSGARE